MSDFGIGKLIEWEGLKTKAYKDSVGVWTIGVGHTSMAGEPHVAPGLTITKGEAIDILKRDLRKFESVVLGAVKVALTQHQFDALVSFCYNVGPRAFTGSTLLRKLNAGDYASVPRELMKWTSGGGHKIQGLVNRRSAEAGLWAKGEFVASRDVEAKPAKVAVLTVDNAVKVATPLSALAQSFTSGPAQIILVAAVVLGGAYLLWRFTREHKEASA